MSSSQSVLLAWRILSYFQKWTWMSNWFFWLVHILFQWQQSWHELHLLVHVVHHVLLIFQLKKGNLTFCTKCKHGEILICTFWLECRQIFLIDWLHLTLKCWMLLCFNVISNIWIPLYVVLYNWICLVMHSVWWMAHGKIQHDLFHWCFSLADWQ